MTPIEAGELLLKSIDYILDQYPKNYDIVGEMDKQCCDITHEIEFTPLDVQRGYKLAKQLQDVKKIRRIAKDENELLKAMYDFLTQGTSTAFKNGFINALQKAKQREKTLPLRVYGPRSEAFKETELRSDAVD